MMELYVEPLEGEESPSDASHLFLRLPIATYVDDGAWRDHAKCKSLGTKNFFGEVTRGEMRQPLIDSAVAICKTCSVRKECFNFAKKSGEQFGVWGGIDFYISKKAKVRRVIPDTID